MKNKTDKAAATEALRVAALKVVEISRIAEADDRLARAAKGKFKDAKKNWKLARKVAKRSAKRAWQAEKNLAALRKHLKRASKKSSAKPVKKPKTAPRKRSAKSSVNRISASISPAAMTPASGDTGPL